MRGWGPRAPRFFEEFEETEEIAPPVESYIKNGNLVVRADVPGIHPEDIDVSILQDILAIRCDRKSDKEIREKDYLRREVAYGAFERRLSLPEGVAADQVKASFKNRIAEVSIPLPMQVATKKIPSGLEGGKKVEIEHK